MDPQERAKIRAIFEVQGECTSSLTSQAFWRHRVEIPMAVDSRPPVSRHYRRHPQLDIIFVCFSFREYFTQNSPSVSFRL